jgi:hypothetical protein
MAIPGVGLYGEQMALAEKAYEQALADIQRRRTALLQQLGMKPIMGSNGTIKSLVVDPKNPYGEYQQLRKSEATDLTATENDSLARGLSPDEGLGGQPISSLRYTQHVGDLNFTRNAMSNLGSLAREQQQAHDQKNMSIMQAQEAALQAAIAAGAYGPGPTVPAPTAATTTPGPAPTPSAPTPTPGLPNSSIAARPASYQKKLAGIYGGTQPESQWRPYRPWTPPLSSIGRGIW